MFIFLLDLFNFKKNYDVIVFCHGNSGNRLGIEECLDIILEHGFLAFAFDFSGFQS